MTLWTQTCIRHSKNVSIGVAVLNSCPTWTEIGCIAISIRWGTACCAILTRRTWNTITFAVLVNVRLVSSCGTIHLIIRNDWWLSWTIVSCSTSTRCCHASCITVLTCRAENTVCVACVWLIKTNRTRSFVNNLARAEVSSWAKRAWLSSGWLWWHSTWSTLESRTAKNLLTACHASVRTVVVLWTRLACAGWCLPNKILIGSYGAIYVHRYTGWTIRSLGTFDSSFRNSSWRAIVSRITRVSSECGLTWIEAFETFDAWNTIWNHRCASVRHVSTNWTVEPISVSLLRTVFTFGTWNGLIRNTYGPSCICKFVRRCTCVISCVCVDSLTAVVTCRTFVAWRLSSCWCVKTWWANSLLRWAWRTEVTCIARNLLGGRRTVVSSCTNEVSFDWSSHASVIACLSKRASQACRDSWTTCAWIVSINCAGYRCGRSSRTVVARLALILLSRRRSSCAEISRIAGHYCWKFVASTNTSLAWWTWNFERCCFWAVVSRWTRFHISSNPRTRIASCCG